ncbi:MAG: ABC transporter ATP-binding protein, partial [Planctomycetota bacterium]
MSNDIAIRVENLGKMFRLGELERYTTLRDTLQRSVTRGVRRLFGKSGRNGSTDDNGSSRREKNTIWALKDVSFEVKHGEVLGIIGRNGAGKSTLLKILSRITEPTTGYAEIRGRVGSLLEVGTGFHPELTGRENVYLNGSILGMSQREIRKKFDDIVSFAGVEKFIDTPVKRYSSGMQVRLAFAVAAHPDPEILIIDEVLAVGDAEFQKRCLGKMDEVAHSGRTILFVSHNMAAVENLCTATIFLHEGELLSHDTTETVVTQYLNMTSGAAEAHYQIPSPNYLRAITIRDCNDLPRTHFKT